MYNGADFSLNIEKLFGSLQTGQIYKTVIASMEKILIEKALDRAGGNQILAARILGLNRNTLRTKIKKYQIDREQFK